MEYWFYYEVDYVKGDINIGAAEYPEVLTPDQEQRLKASYASGKFRYMGEDPELQDIYDKLYADILEQERGCFEYGHLAGIDLFPVRIEYPNEITGRPPMGAGTVF